MYRILGLDGKFLNNAAAHQARLTLIPMISSRFGHGNYPSFAVVGGKSSYKQLSTGWRAGQRASPYERQDSVEDNLQRPQVHYSNCSYETLPKHSMKISYWSRYSRN